MNDKKQVRQTDKHTGIIYVYEAETYWDKKSKHTRYRNRKLLGHVDKATGEVVPNRPTQASPANPESRRLFYGVAHLLNSLSDQIGLGADLRRGYPGMDNAIASIAQFLLCEDTSAAARFARWSRTHVHPFGREISSQRASELFETIGDKGTEEFFRARVARAGHDYWFYDTTSISSYSQYIESVRWGRNKDNVPLPQINLATILDAESGLPVCYRDLPGNISDVVLIRQLLNETQDLGIKRIRLCLDRGFYSKANIDALMAEHMKFLVGCKTSITFVGKAIRDNSSELRGWQNYDKASRTYLLRLPVQWDFEQTKKRAYLILCFSPERALKDEEELSQLLGILSYELNSGCRQDDHERHYERYFKQIRGGRYIGRDDIIALERERFGYFALLSNDASLSAADAYKVYRSKDKIEKAFGDVKSRLGFRTPKVENTETLRGKLLCTFVALILASELRKRMTASGIDEKYTLQGLIDELDTIERYEHQRHHPRIITVTKKQKDIYVALGVEPLCAS